MMEVQNCHKPSDTLDTLDIEYFNLSDKVGICCHSKYR